VLNRWKENKMQKLFAWIALSRLPFTSFGLLPFVLGTILAGRQTAIRYDIFVLSALAAFLIMLSSHYAGEFWDMAEDTLSAKAGAFRFAGGSQVILKKLLPRRAPMAASIISLLLAAAIGFVLQFGLKTGRLTIPFGMIAIFGGFFYSARPVRWVSKGLGEIWIAFCYGWLPVAVGFYLQAGKMIPLVNWLSVPIVLTVFNVILLNEFPDYHADKQTGKKNLLVRLGQINSSYLYGLISFSSWVATFFLIYSRLPKISLVFYLPILIISFVLVAFMLTKRWHERLALEKLCAANLIVNLGTTLVLLAAVVF
jgi:1,4-dihydroxy-2-naphthoate octaprenyltransferase